MRKNQMRSRRADVDAHALEREHLEPFDICDNVAFLNTEIFRMTMIVNVVVHAFPQSALNFSYPYNRNPRSLAGIPNFNFLESSGNIFYCFPIALDHS